MKDLPKVYVNKIDKDIKNYQEDTLIRDNNSLDLKSILSKNKYSFNHIYNITLNNNKVIKDSIIIINDKSILTIDNSWIKISDIKYIEEIKK